MLRADLDRGGESALDDARVDRARGRRVFVAPEPHSSPLASAFASDSIGGPHRNLDLTDAVDPLGDALDWKRRNPEAYRALVLWAKEDVANGVRPSMDAYGHLLRRPHMAARLGLTRRTGEPVLFNDHLTSSLARLLRREHGIPFATREARVDSWPGAS